MILPSNSSLPSVLALTVPTALFLASISCSDSGSEAAFEIISPASQNVTVMPGESVRFEIRTTGGRTVEYLVDGDLVEEGPVFTFLPTNEHHVIQALIRSSQPMATPDVVEFTVDVEVPGNLSPQITSFAVDPQSGEAGTTTFTVQVTASDPDGTIEDLSIDWGDGSPPARGSSSPLTATHMYAIEGTYTIVGRAADDVGIPVSSTHQVEVAPHNEPPRGTLDASLVSGGAPKGTGPLTVVLSTEGTDPDGTIATWEIDKDRGDGFELIAPGENVMVTYEFREQPFVPVLRLTDDRGASAEIPVDEQILVLRDVSVVNSKLTVSGNPRFADTGIAPAIWASGSDPFEFIVDVRDSAGDPVVGVPLRITTTRDELFAQDGTSLGPAVSIVPDQLLITDSGGRASGSLVTTISTRVEAVPAIDFEPFVMMVEVDRGHGTWVTLEDDSGPLNAETLVQSTQGRSFLIPFAGCPGQPLEIHVETVKRPDAPGGGAPANRYTELRFLDGTFLSGLTPAAGYSNWRTDTAGKIVFEFTPSREDENRIYYPWVDGQRLPNWAVLLKPRGECGGQ